MGVVNNEIKIGKIYASVNELTKVELPKVYSSIAAITALDLPTVKEKADNAVLWSERKGYVGKNRIKNISSASTEKNGITFTVNSDNSITVSGTAGAQTDFTVYDIVANSVDKDASLKNSGKYILSGCPAGGSESTYFMQWYKYNGVDTLKDTGSGVEVNTSPYTAATYDNVTIRIMNGTVISSPITFYPMIRKTSISDSTYEPYIKSNEELASAKLDTATLKTVTTSAADFSAFKTAIAAL